MNEIMVLMREIISHVAFAFQSSCKLLGNWQKWQYHDLLLSQGYLEEFLE